MTRPAYDPDLRALLADLPMVPALDATTLDLIRPYASTPVEPLLDGRDVTRRELTVPAADGARIPLSIIGPAAPTAPAAAPCVYWVHGGGMVMGDRYSQLDIPLEWLDRFGAVVVSVDYRLAARRSSRRC